MSCLPLCCQAHPALFESELNHYVGHAGGAMAPGLAQDHLLGLSPAPGAAARCGAALCSARPASPSDSRSTPLCAAAKSCVDTRTPMKPIQPNYEAKCDTRMQVVQKKKQKKHSGYWDLNKNTLNNLLVKSKRNAEKTPEQADGKGAPHKQF